MKLFYKTPILLIIIILISSFKVNNEQKEMNILIITGGHKFEKESFYNMFNSFKGIKWEEAKHPNVFELFKNEKIHDYDAVVFYDSPSKIEISEEQKKYVLEGFKKGIPAVFMHHALVTYLDFDEYIKIIGGRFYRKTAFIAPDSNTYQSECTHDVEYSLSFNKKHPICNGLKDFTIIDETYKKYYLEPDITPIVTTNSNLSDSIIGWSNKYKNSTTVCLLNGHGPTAYNNKNYRKLLYNAIRWVAEEKYKKF